MLRRMLFAFIFICLSTPSACFCLESVTIQTYYPAPAGVYNQVTAVTLVSQALSVGDVNGDGDINEEDVPDITTEPGRVWIVDRAGIGTSNPEALLHVSGDSSNANKSIAIFESGPDAADIQLRIMQETNRAAIELRVQDGSSASGELILNPGGGNVGVGTLNPQAALDVAGDMSVDVALQIRGTVTSVACNAGNRGVIAFDDTASDFKGCNGSGWVAF